tara:strand:+ start:301 stop:741 length:441 start_codon:yes stop_codon:yes gene_type:complete
MLIRENIEYLIKKNRLKLLEFGKILGVSMAVAGTYKNGRAKPSYETLLVLSDKFNISCDDLLKKDLSKEEGSNNGLVKESNATYRPTKEDTTPEVAALKTQLLQLLQNDAAVAKAVTGIIEKEIIKNWASEQMPVLKNKLTTEEKA